MQKKKKKKKKNKKKKRKKRMGKGLVPFSLVVIAVLVAIALAWGRMHARARPRYVAVVSSGCGHCRRAKGDMDAFGTRHMFHVMDVDDVSGDDQVMQQLSEMGYTGSVPFFANVESGSKVTGYMPHKDVLAALSGS